MEQMRGARGTAAKPVTRETSYEDLYPSSDWTHDPKCHVLIIDLPGFNKEELKVRIDNFRKLTISGERKVTENKYQRFKQVFEVPEDSDLDNISGRFDGGLLFIIIPKITVEEEKQPVNATNEIEEEKKDEKRAYEEIPKKDTVKEQHHPEMPKDAVKERHHPEMPKDAVKERHHPEMPKEDAVKEQHHPEMPKDAVKERHHPEMPKEDAVKERHHHEMPKEDAVKERHHHEMPKNDGVNEQYHAPDLQSEKKAETWRNAEQEGLKDIGTYKMVNEKKEDSDRTGWKAGLIGDRMPKMDKDWRRITEKVKNKEEMEVLMRSAMEKIRKNKTIILTAVIAFSIGMYISQ